MENVNDTFFDGYYKDIWRTMIPELMTVKEVEFMIDHFQLGTQSKVLDLMCGYGRHAIGLAEKGVDVTAVDNLQAYIDEVQKLALSRRLPITATKADVVNYQSKGKFDLVICMGNSLNFFDEENTRKILSSISKHLNPGGHFLFHSWSILEIAVKTFQSQSKGLVGKIQMETSTKFLFQPTRMEAVTRMISDDGITEIKEAIDYVYSIAEYDRMLSDEGMIISKIYSIPGKKEFALGDPRAYIISRKVT